MAPKKNTTVQFSDAELTAMEKRALSEALHAQQQEEEDEDEDEDPTLETDDDSFDEGDEQEGGDGFEDDEDALFLLSTKLDDIIQTLVTADGVALADVMADIANNLAKLVKITHAVSKRA